MILVTGGTGLLGSHLLFELLKEDVKVRATKRAGSNTKGVEAIFRFYGDANLDKYSRIEWVDADVLDYESLQNGMRGIETVFHAAAYVSFSRKNHSTMWDINVDGTKNMLDAALESGVKLFCHVSSIASLGSGINGSATTESDQWQPDDKHSVYSLSKFRSEMEVWQAAENGLRTIIVNPSVILGPGTAQSSTTKIIKLAERDIPFFTEGMTGYVDVADVASAMVKLSKTDISNQRFIVSAQDITSRELITMMANKLNSKPPRHKAKRWMLRFASIADKVSSAIMGREPSLTSESLRAATGRSSYSSEKIIKELNFKFTPIDSTIEKSIEFYRKEVKS